MDLLRRAVRTAEEATDRAGAAGREAAAKAQRDLRAADEAAAEAAAALARERSDRRADAAAFADERKELQVATRAQGAQRLSRMLSKGQPLRDYEHEQQGTASTSLSCNHRICTGALSVHVFEGSAVLSRQVYVRLLLATSGPS